MQKHSGVQGEGTWGEEQVVLYYCGEGLGEVKDIADRGKGFPEDMGFVGFFLSREMTGSDMGFRTSSTWSAK